MRWGDERYVRVYTRDTVDDDMLCWQARAVWPLVLRKVDRAGILDLGKHGVRGLAVLIKLPLEVVQPALERSDGLLADGRMELHGDVLVIPNFIEAQETPQSEAQRSREYRARSRDIARAKKLVTETKRDGEETKGDGADTNRIDDVTPLPELVTSRHSVPSVLCRAVPNQTEGTRHARPRDEDEGVDQGNAPRANSIDLEQLAVAWSKRAGVAFVGGLVEARDLMQSVFAARGVTEPWTDVAVRAVDVFERYRQTCSPGKRPVLNGLKLCDHWERLEPVLFGVRELDVPEPRLGPKPERLDVGVAKTGGWKPEPGVRNANDKV